MASSLTSPQHGNDSGDGWPRVCRAAARLFCVPASGLVLGDGDAYVTEMNLAPDGTVTRRSLRRARSTSRTVLDTRRPVFVSDLRLTHALHETKVPDGVIAFGAVALDVAGAPGALWVGDTVPRTWTERDRERLADSAQLLGDILPVVTSPGADPAPSCTSASGLTATILIVEDDAGVRAFTRRALERLGHRVLEADSADAAFGVIEGTGEPIHLVITDIVMPGMSGRELAIRLSIEQPSVRLLLMSGHDGVADEVQREDGLPFLQKPFSMEHLAASVGRALGTAA